MFLTILVLLEGHIHRSLILQYFLGKQLFSVKLSFSFFIKSYIFTISIISSDNGTSNVYLQRFSAQLEKDILSSGRNFCTFYFLKGFRAVFRTFVCYALCCSDPKKKVLDPPNMNNFWRIRQHFWRI